MNLTIKDLLSIPHKGEQGISNLSPKKRFREVSTDSRSIKKNDLFVALRGEKFDGHDFIQDIEKRALAAIVDEKWHKKNKLKTKLPLLIVKNTLDSYGDLAHLYRKKFSIPILCIAGSNGKTTTKEVISHVLGTSFNVLKTEANYNNQVGLPRMLLSLKREHEIAVLEIGTNHPGEIAWLTKVAAPTMGLITNIGKEHLEFFKDITAVAKEELALFDYLYKEKRRVFINMDDSILAKQKERFGKRGYEYGAGTDTHGEAIRFTSEGKLKMRITLFKHPTEIESNLIADYAPSLFAAAAIAGMTQVIDMKKVIGALKTVKPFSKRMEVVKLTNGVIAINDAYNANPESFVSALKTLQQIPAKGKKYVIAGDMFELGLQSAKEHRLLGKEMAHYKFDGYFFTGKDMKQAFAALVNANKKLHASHDSSKEDIVNALHSVLKKGDVILVKGSRGMKMETVVEEITK